MISCVVHQPAIDGIIYALVTRAKRLLPCRVCTKRDLPVPYARQLFHWRAQQLLTRFLGCLGLFGPAAQTLRRSGNVDTSAISFGRSYVYSACTGSGSGHPAHLSQRTIGTQRLLSPYRSRFSMKLPIRVRHLAGRSAHSGGLISTTVIFAAVSIHLRNAYAISAPRGAQRAVIARIGAPVPPAKSAVKSGRQRLPVVYPFR